MHLFFQVINITWIVFDLSSSIPCKCLKEMQVHENGNNVVSFNVVWGVDHLKFASIFTVKRL